MCKKALVSNEWLHFDFVFRLRDICIVVDSRVAPVIVL